MFLLPPREDVCQVCAVVHLDGEPHDAGSIYYQYWFWGHHGRWPTWADAIAHCRPQLQELWRQALQERGAWTEPADGVPIAELDSQHRGARDGGNIGSCHVTAMAQEVGRGQAGGDAGAATD